MQQNIQTTTSKVWQSALVLSASLSLYACGINAQEAPVVKAIAKPKAIKRVRPTLSAATPLIVVYPPPQTTVNAPSSFIIGATYPGTALTLSNNQSGLKSAVTLNSDGFFAQVIPLIRGSNSFDLGFSGPSGSYKKTIQINREKLKGAIAANTFAIDKNSLEPAEDRGVTAGDIVEFSCRATPNCQVEVELGSKKIKLTSLASLRSAIKNNHGKAPTNPINKGLETAYGQVFQRYPANSPDLYVGLYKIQPGDNFAGAHPVFTLKNASQSESVALGTTIEVISQPRMAHTVHDDTIVRVAPELARLTPLPEGVRVLTDGYQKDSIRVLYKVGKHVWIKKEDLAFEDPAAPAPRATPTTIQVQKDNYGEIITLPLQERLPFIIEQSLTPNKLVLKLYGGTANTDWAYQAPENDSDSQLIENIAWKQPEDNVYELDLSLKSGRQWGYYADYDDNNLNLHIKYPPALTPLAQGNSGPRLAGLKVCIDPGHGGTESGALGPSGITEAEINLAIALKLKALLEAEGVNVCMTRTEDTDVSLQDRVDFARDHKVDLLISVHNNALPDGRDPLKEHGTSTYRYHPQSVELARTLKNSMVKDLSLPDLGARYQNLALCRPTAMQAVLLEVAFVVNPDEYSHLINNEWQAKAAKSMLNGMLSYFGRQ